MQPNPAHTAKQAAIPELVKDAPELVKNAPELVKDAPELVKNAMGREEARVQDLAACERREHLLTNTTGTCRRCLTRFMSQIAVRRGKDAVLVVLEQVEVAPNGMRTEPTVLDVIREFDGNASFDALHYAEEIARSRLLKVEDGLNHPAARSPLAAI